MNFSSVSVEAALLTTSLCVLRSLDLTGPLLLGGVPKLPEDFPVRNQQFVGCMKNLRIDNQHVDMASYFANNGTLPGKSAFCSAALFCLLVEQPSVENLQRK